MQGAFDFVEVAAGRSHACALTPEGHAWCWGSNLSGQLGIAIADAGPFLAPQAVTGGLVFSRLQTGDSTTCGVTPEGEALCWGSNTGGKLGTGDLENRLAPTPVIDP